MITFLARALAARTIEKKKSHNTLEIKLMNLWTELGVTYIMQFG